MFGEISTVALRYTLTRFEVVGDSTEVATEATSVRGYGNSLLQFEGMAIHFSIHDSKK